MWRGFGAESESENAAQRSYFRPRISSISGVLAMTKQRLFTSSQMKDDEHMAHTASIHPIAVGGGPGASAGIINTSHLLAESMNLNGALPRCPSPARSSYGDILSFSRSASARPSIDSQTAHAIYGAYGDPLGIHDPSEVELNGANSDTNGSWAKRGRKIIRGFFMMVIVALCWVSFVHLLRLSFRNEKVLFSISSISSKLNTPPLSQDLQRWPTNNPWNNTPTTPVDVSRAPGEALEEPRSNFNKKVSDRSRSNKTSSSKSNKAELRFDAPYFVTWFCTIWNVFYLPFYLMIHSCFLSRHAKSNNNEAATGNDSDSASGSVVSKNGGLGSNKKNKDTESNADDDDDTSMKKVLVESIQGLMDKSFTLMQFFVRLAFFTVMCTLANYMLIFITRILDATVVLSLFSCTASVVYLLSWVVLHQQFVGIRIVAIIICDTGIALLVYMDGVQHQTLATVMIGFGSAIVFGIYKVVMRRVIGFTTFAQMALFHTLIGLLNALLAWPLVLLLYATGIETIIWSEIPWAYITGAAACSFLANIIVSFGVIWTYEVMLTLGLFFAIPISALIDIYIYSVVFKDMKLGGVLLILCGFLVVLLPVNWNEYLTSIFRNRLAKWKRREEKKKTIVRGQQQQQQQDATSTGQLSRLRTSMLKSS